MSNCQNKEKKPNTTGFLLYLLYSNNNSNIANSTYPQTFADQDTAIIIDRTVTNLYNTNIAAKMELLPLRELLQVETLRQQTYLMR